MNCTLSRPEFSSFVGFLSAVSIALIFGSILFIPLAFIHILLFSIFSISFENSIVLAIYISIVLLGIFLPVYLYLGIKRSHEDIRFQFCDEGFYINDAKYDYKDIENVEVTSSIMQNLLSLKNLKITTSINNEIKYLYFRNIKEPQSLISRIACPMK